MADDLNVGKPWSEMDVADLRSAIGQGDSARLIASFLMRTEEEVRAKVAEMELKVRA